MKRFMSYLLSIIIVISGIVTIMITTRAIEKKEFCVDSSNYNKTPNISSFILEYNGNTYDLLSEEKQDICIYEEDDLQINNLSFKIKIDESDLVDSIFVVSEKNGEKKYLKALYNENYNGYVTNGYFDPDNHNYIPENIKLMYNFKNKKTEIDENWIINIENEKLQDEFIANNIQLINQKDNEQEYKIDFATGDTISYKYSKYTSEDYIKKTTEATVNSKLNISSLSASFDKNVNTKFFVEQGWEYIKGNLNGEVHEKYYVFYESEGEIKAAYYDLNTDSVEEEIISNLKGNGIRLLKSYLPDSIKESVDLYDTIGGSLKKDYNNLLVWGDEIIDLEQIKQNIISNTSLSEKDRQDALEKVSKIEQEKTAIAIFKVLGNNLKTLSSFSLDPTISTTLWCAGYTIENIIPYFIEHSEYIDTAKAVLEANLPILPITWSGNKWSNTRTLSTNGYAFSGYYNAGKTINLIYNSTIGAADCICINNLSTQNRARTTVISKSGSTIYSGYGNPNMVPYSKGISQVKIEVISGTVFINAATIALSRIFYNISGCSLVDLNTNLDKDNISLSNAYKTDDNGVYLFVDTPLSFEEARDWCIEKGGHLVTISSKEENDYISDLMNKNKGFYYMIGIYKSTIDDQWKNVNGEEVSFINWISGSYPDVNRCGVLTKTGGWKTIEYGKDSFDGLYGFICEWDDDAIYEEKYRTEKNNVTSTPVDTTKPNTDPAATDPTESTSENYTCNTVYLKNTLNWSNPYCYMWTGSGGAGNQNGSWPGVRMQSLGNGIYSYVIPDNYSKIIFNNNGSSQTKDLEYPGNNMIYDNLTGLWSHYEIEQSTEEPIVTVTTPTTVTKPSTTKPVVKKTTVSLSKHSANLYVKSSTVIKPTVKYGKGKTTYKSSNTKVAKVYSNGKVIALKTGTAKITVTNNKVSKVFTVKVLNPKLNKTSVTIVRGKSFTLKVIGKIGKATFVSSNKKIATVSSAGKITVNKKAPKGKTLVIIVKSNGVTLKCKVKTK